MNVCMWLREPQSLCYYNLFNVYGYIHTVCIVKGLLATVVSHYIQLCSYLLMCIYICICLVCLVCYPKSTNCDPTDTIALAETADQCCRVAKSVLNPRTGSCMPCDSNPGM